MGARENDLRVWGFYSTISGDVIKILGGGYFIVTDRT